MALITDAQAIAHLNVDLVSAPPNLDLMMTQAEAIVIDYIKQPDHEWTIDDVPGEIQAAILLTLGSLDADRTGAGVSDLLKPEGAVARLVHRHRDPAMA